MNKAELNKEIIECRTLVKKARLRAIQNIIRKANALRASKNIEERERKSKKADRLIEQVMVMKKVKVDNVTKFALLHANLDATLQATPATDNDHIYAILAKHVHIQKRIEKLRERVPNYDDTIPLLLQSLGERTMLKKWKAINKGIDPTEVITSVKKLKGERERKKKIDKKQESTPSDEDSPESVEVKELPKKEEKVQDLFFVDKKIILPKLLRDSDDTLSSNIGKPFMRGENVRFKKAERTPFTETIPTEEGREEIIENKKWQARDKLEMNKRLTPSLDVNEPLHPSWAAKKIKLIQPFQGKKIIFDID